MLLLLFASEESGMQTDFANVYCVLYFQLIFVHNGRHIFCDFNMASIDSLILYSTFHAFCSESKEELTCNPQDNTQSHHLSELKGGRTPSAASLLLLLFISVRNLFLILDLTHFETKGQLAGITTSKLDAGSPTL